MPSVRARKEEGCASTEGASGVTAIMKTRGSGRRRLPSLSITASSGPARSGTRSACTASGKGVRRGGSVVLLLHGLCAEGRDRYVARRAHPPPHPLPGVAGGGGGGSLRRKWPGWPFRVRAAARGRRGPHPWLPGGADPRCALPKEMAIAAEGCAASFAASGGYASRPDLG